MHSGQSQFLYGRISVRLQPRVARLGCSSVGRRPVCWLQGTFGCLHLIRYNGPAVGRHFDVTAALYFTDVPSSTSVASVHEVGKLACNIHLCAKGNILFTILEVRVSSCHFPKADLVLVHGALS